VIATAAARATRPRRMLVLVLITSCVGCGGSSYLRAQGGRLSPIADPKPSDYAGRKPVVVLEGDATYYSDSLAGNHTSNGDVYDPGRRTAASRDLPFDSIVRVVRRDNGKSVLVRVNDRGPFGSKRRILDLSRLAADDLGMLQRGVAPVRAEVLVLGPTKASSRKRRR